MLIADLMEKLKYAGVRGVVKHLGYDLANRLVYFDCLHAMTLELQHVDKKYLGGPPEGMTIRFLTEAEVRKFAENPILDLDKSYVDESLANGDQCLAILDGDNLASYGWAGTGPTKITGEFNLNVTSDWVYMYRGFTNPAYRGRRLQGIGMAHAVKTFAAQGYKGITSIVASTNAASLKSCERSGYSHKSRIYLVGHRNHFFAFHTAGGDAIEAWVTSRREGPAFHLINLPDIARATPDEASDSKKAS